MAFINFCEHDGHVFGTHSRDVIESYLCACTNFPGRQEIKEWLDDVLYSPTGMFKNNSIEERDALKHVAPMLWFNLIVVTVPIDKKQVILKISTASVARTSVKTEVIIQIDEDDSRFLDIPVKINLNKAEPIMSNTTTVKTFHSSDLPEVVMHLTRLSVFSNHEDGYAYFNSKLEKFKNLYDWKSPGTINFPEFLKRTRVFMYSLQPGTTEAGTPIGRLTVTRVREGTDGDHLMFEPLLLNPKTQMYFTIKMPEPAAKEAPPDCSFTGLLADVAVSALQHNVTCERDDAGYLVGYIEGIILSHVPRMMQREKGFLHDDIGAIGAYMATQQNYVLSLLLNADGGELYFEFADTGLPFAKMEMRKSRTTGKLKFPGVVTTPAQSAPETPPGPGYPIWLDFKDFTANQMLEHMSLHTNVLPSDLFGELMLCIHNCRNPQSVTEINALLTADIHSMDETIRFNGVYTGDYSMGLNGNMTLMVTTTIKIPDVSGGKDATYGTTQAAPRYYNLVKSGDTPSGYILAYTTKPMWSSPAGQFGPSRGQFYVPFAGHVDPYRRQNNFFGAVPPGFSGRW